ncbi:MerR family transcriptional regulator [Microbacterium sp. cx-55]|uniref:MerR family transcriptional regulator n=1 Tax=unclassified Microbacterium TaxID=2609290 RepID=UPI001CC0D444|nr:MULTISPECIES: MerR family transcriptional regulator [unclassified Microbacterium]MBZ4487876.1 MerR family transcriptional regulator [Microbacterium sp. cx-55]MCC4909092.1 MerR family transcriptional regulator [Microbacterium sp. cx-59]UGB34713.1 MerR family transcriptional regulator [Microbacterium sp. cx-55]
MKIGQVAELTGIPTRMLRYYEQQGLLASERSLNGYRTYTETDVERATRVRALIQSGLSTRMAKIVLDLEDQNERAVPPECSVPLAQELAAELDALDSRLSCLTRSRDALARYLQRAAPDGVATS